ncbi:serine/threonine-protein phosphatase 6 regulatory ankyrin repeat subunit B-like isoform X1 [Mercenaria mercenaria]|uniref:serine/threonine-protein phosphatase 6 regulatory ankyrin repeat subunit B-like isoform X1 n=2 Tax=Mercenaria mercenaria TaxID=6596 RepID=UPI00234F35D9|nr:serine/threonine-protein phosphatase 6 regulatory ankyrin repeat subunit B-like isoform X1 [Mercenaria mercenaria]
MNSRRHLKRIDEEDVYALKYNVPFPLHAAACAGDTEAIEYLARRKHVNSYNEVGQMPLHIAAQQGQYEAAKLLLKLDADVNTPDRSSGRTALHLACANSHKSTVELLLKMGAVVYEQDKNGVYPVHLAAGGGHCGVIQFLVATGALVRCQDKNNTDPMHLAAQQDKSDTIGTLHGFGGNLDATNKDGETPLHIAAVSGSAAAIRKLYQLGANLDSRDKFGDTPLHHATRVEKLTSIEVLAEVGADLNSRNDIKECPIHLAARLGRWKSIRHLLTAGVDIDVPYKKGLQAIHIAAQYGLCDVIRVLKIEHADLNAKDKNGNRPLHHAAKKEQNAAIRVLVELGADINAPRKRQDTAIHMATKEKKTNIVQLLASLGADCNKENESALGPLYYAAVNEDVPTSKCLLRCGADINTLNSEGEGLVHIMVEEERLEGLSTMKELKANFSLLNEEGITCVHIASREGQTHVLKHLKDIGVDLSVKDKLGLSALHVAVMEDKGEEVDMLNNIGVDLDCRSKNFTRDADMPPLCKTCWPPKDVERIDYWKIKTGMTPVHLAFCFDHEDILSHLVTCGADINIGNDAGETIFHLAIFFNMADWLQKLLTLGADRNCKDKYGRTPLHYAAHTGSLGCLRVLLKFGAVITESDNEGRQPLHYAAESGHFLLLPEFTGHSRAVDINCVDNHGLTPLHLACRSGQIETIVELIQLRANVEALDDSGNTVVHLAAANGQHEIIVQLASLGCNMDVQNKDMKTPLHMAAESGQGEAMEYLLMCGCNPNIRDKNENLPNTFRLPVNRKHAVTKRIKQYNENHSSRHTSGEISYDCWMVSVGKQVDLPRLGITVTLESSAALSSKPIVFIHRSPADSAHLDIPLTGLEEILSDVYELRVLCLESECTLMIEIPLDGYPGSFESYLKTTENEEFKEYTTSEENGVPTFVTKVPISRGTVKKFAVLARPRVYKHKIGSDGGTIMSDLNRKIRLEVPENTFEDLVDINMQVVETRDMDRKPDRIFAADIINLNSERQPLDRIKLQIPLHSESDDGDDIVVFVVNREDEIDDERRWMELESSARHQNDCITFWVKHFCIYVPVRIARNSSLTIDAAKRMAKERIKSALHRETSVLFFYALFPKKDSYLVIFECTTPGRFQRRREFWENEGFFLHSEVKHSGHFEARPNQSFFFDVTGNMKYVGSNSRKLKLTFNPRSYKFQSFYLTRINKNLPQIGEFQVFTSLPNIEAKTGNQEVLVTSLPIDIPQTTSCVIA